MKIEEFNEKEVWKDVPGYEGFYEASINGRIRSLPRNGTCKSIKELKMTLNWNNYLKVVLNKGGIKKSIRVHRVIAIAFIPNPDRKTQVNHKNRLKYDNRVSNLEWSTASENNLHAYEGLHGKKAPIKIIKGPFSKEFKTAREAAKFLNLKSTASFNQVISGKAKRAAGYFIEYLTK